MADTGFYFDPPGPKQDRAFGEVEWEIQQYPTLQALWVGIPVRSSIDLDHAC